MEALAEEQIISSKPKST